MGTVAGHHFEVHRTRNKFKTMHRVKMYSKYVLTFIFLTSLAVDLSGGQPQNSRLSGKYLYLSYLYCGNNSNYLISRIICVINHL